METSPSSPQPVRKTLSISRVTRSIFFGLALFILGFTLSRAIVTSEKNIQLVSPLGTNVVVEPENPYLPYRFSVLRDLALTAQPITFTKVLEAEPSFTSFEAWWSVPNLTTGKYDRVTAQVNIPQGTGPFPIVVMARGYADREIYTTGLGTRNAAAVFARNGYITIAPDFLGYGGSDPEASDVLIARFSRPLALLQLITDIENLQVVNQVISNSDQATPSAQVNRTLFDTNSLVMWAHSNGGQIALSVLEITGRAIPTTLWAPVSKPFPYSVLYYTDESPDGGKFLRTELANFEFTLKNNPAEYSILAETHQIEAPIQIHQGTADDAVPVSWSQDLQTTLESATVSSELFIYPGADHNLAPRTNWEQAVQRDLQFFAKHLRK